MGIETILSVGGPLLGSFMESEAVGDAADSQAAGTAAGIAEQRRQYDLTRSDYAPWRGVGGNALQELAYELGIPGYQNQPETEAQIRQRLLSQYTTPGTPGTQQWVGMDHDGNNGTLQFVGGTPGGVNETGLNAAIQAALAEQTANPARAPRTQVDLREEALSELGYQFGLQQGQQALDRKTAAAGGRVSGAALKASSRYNTDYAATGYDRAWQRREDRLARLQSLAGLGQSATSGTAGAGSNSSNAISNLLNQQGTNAGSASLAQGNIWGNAINRGVSQYNNRTQQAPSANWLPSVPNDVTLPGW